MSDSVFHFKQFLIHQDKCAMKVGTDAVLLGSWVNTLDSNSILDIGTGTGLIAIMLAQKSHVGIEAIDMDENACEQARENISLCPWYDRIKVFHASLQDFKTYAGKKYALIVSNPPYFVDASKAPEAARNKARHTDNLSFKDLIEGVKELLDPEGRFCMILPNKEGADFMELASLSGLHCTELVKIKTKIDKQEKRWLMQFEFNTKSMKCTELILQVDDSAYSQEYIELTKDYYLNLKSR
jgi:tRNA1Val (adenine37-N6)-methyltransferase